MDVLKSRFIILYTILLLLLSWSVFSLDDNSGKGTLSLLNVVLLTVPLVSIMYATSYLYNSSEFIELLLSQPVTRTKIWTSLYFVLTVALSLACILGIGIPLVFFSLNTTGAMLLLTGVLITMIFVAFAMVATVLTRDKAKGIGLSIILWLFFSLFFDGLMLFFVFQFSDYPIEKLMLGASLLNPISISRNLILLQLDISAIMGYTGAIFKAFFGTTLGIFFSFTILLLWAIIPFIFSLRRFKSKDL